MIAGNLQLKLDNPKSQDRLHMFWLHDKHTARPASLIYCGHASAAKSCEWDQDLAGGRPARVDNPLPAVPWGSAAVVARVPWIPSCGGCVVYPIYFCAYMEVSSRQLLLHLKGIFKENRPEHELGPIEPS